LALACHLRIAAEHAQFGQPEVKLGVAPGYGGTQRLPRLVGSAAALHLILTGDMIDAAEAYRIGLVHRVVPAGDLMAEAERLVRRIAAQAPLAVRLALEAVIRGRDMPLEQGLLLEANHFGLLTATADMKEGLAAFLAKRPPRFGGRSSPLPPRSSLRRRVSVSASAPPRRGSSSSPRVTRCNHPTSCPSALPRT
jgi:enoyl-CoA hydratase